MMSGRYYVGNYSIDADMVEKVRNVQLTLDQAKEEMKKRMQNLNGGQAQASIQPVQNNINPNNKRSELAMDTQAILETLRSTPHGKELVNKVNSGEMTLQQACYEAVKRESEDEKILAKVAAFANKNRR